MAVNKGRGSAAAAVAIAVVVGLLALAPGAYAATYLVGGPGQEWDYASNGFSYDTNWVPNQTFRVNDVLQFTYVASGHDVVQYATQGEYDACAGTIIQKWQTGNDMITLNSTGEKFFICSLPGHCTRGMKVSVNVLAATVAPSAGPTPPPVATPSPPGVITPPPPPVATPSPPGVITPPPPPPSTTPGNAASSGPVLSMAGLLAAALVAGFACLV